MPKGKRKSVSLVELVDMKKSFLYTGLSLLAVSLIVGVIVFLRQVNAPTEGLGPLNSSAVSQQKGRTTGAPSVLPTKTRLLRPITPIEQMPVALPYKEGDPKPQINNQPSKP